MKIVNNVVAASCLRHVACQGVGRFLHIDVVCFLVKVFTP